MYSAIVVIKAILIRLLQTMRHLDIYFWEYQVTLSFTLSLAYGYIVVGFVQVIKNLFNDYKTYKYIPIC